MMNRGTIPSAWSLLAAVTASLACASTGRSSLDRFETLYDTGDWPAAVALFDADSVLQADEGAIYRVGLIQAEPTSDLFDPEAARERLGTLVRLFPDSERAVSARVVLGLVDEVVRSRADGRPGPLCIFHSGADRSESLERFHSLYEAGDWAAAAALFDADSTLHADGHAIYRMGLVLSQPSSELFDPEAARTTLGPLAILCPGSERGVSARVVLGLLDELGRSKRASAALQQQLEALKAIDLKPVVPPPPPPPYR